jgi:hypothetical protein
MRRFFPALLGLALLAPAAPAGDTKNDAKKPTYSKSGGITLLTSAAWEGVPKAPATPAEIDRLVSEELARRKEEPAPLTTDEQFIRRVTLDVVGKLPTPAEVQAFAADADPAKRSKLIDKLLASEAYAIHWADYWRDVVAAKVTDRLALAMVPSFEAWLVEQFQANRPWDRLAREMITAEGQLHPGETDAKAGAAYFLLSRNGADAVAERTADTARVFLGLQIQCAQCHDHPFDPWKRTQFHELAGYYARARERRVRLPDAKGVPFAFELASVPFGEHRMPDKDDPNRGTVMPAKFLTGQAPRPGLPDQARRAALADAVTSKDNYWFSAAYANRVWGELMGQAFCLPVDDLGPEKETVMPQVLARLAASFAGSRYDPKAFLKLVLNTQTYQRQLRPASPGDAHRHFAAAAPARLSAESLWQSLTNVLGELTIPPGFMPRRPMGGMGMGPYGGMFSFERQFKNQFAFDPSLKPDEVEGSVPQALMLMNNRLIYSRMRADGPTLLGKLLRDESNDEAAIRSLYLQTLARKPTDREKSRNLDYIHTVDRRAEAYEDILWALVNSTEFQTKR